MLKWTIAFLFAALLAGICGFGGIASLATGIAKILFFLFLAMFIISLLTGENRQKLTENKLED